VHEHAHDEGHHVHIHASHEPGADAEAEQRHGFFHFGRPFFRVKSYTVGVVHGLAGSAAVMLVLLPTLSSFWTGIGYLLMFGIGTMLSMAAVTLLLGVPFAITGGSRGMSRWVSAVAGTASALFGVALMSDIILDTALVPF
jgi:high-affinity nickel-transport protein